jgi:hypothetical protein
MRTAYWIGYWLSVMFTLAAPSITIACLGALTCGAMIVGFKVNEDLT